MKHRELFSISEAAAFARVTRATLLHYDRLGLLKPQARGENKYRYYNSEQIWLVNLIRTLQQLEMPLKDIRKITKNRTPESILALLADRLAYIQQEKEKLHTAERLLLTLQKTIQEAMGVDEGRVTVEHTKAEPIFLGPPNDYSNGRTMHDALLDFYRFCKERDRRVDLNYSAWGVYSGERIRRGDWTWPDHFYLNNPDAPDRKPAGWYAVAYGRGHYGRCDGVYQRLLRFIAEHDLEICGPAYETYPLNEIAECNPDHYLIRISIMVCHGEKFLEKLGPH